MIPQELIRKKRLGQKLEVSEWQDFFSAYLAGKVMDYQASALLMAICLKGMDASETKALTELMRDSGTVFQWPYPREQVVDKHSTGGIGDKTSLIILPLAVLAGVKVPMISGRGLGHTGGTLDKLESIPGFRVQIDEKTARKQIETLGGVFMGQTEDIAPLDRKLYALRDVTGTVESIPLITASILSKKLAEGIGGLVMDVKYGSGAFISEYNEAKKLEESLRMVGEACGIQVVSSLNSMDSPLGECAGNALEVLECIEIMQGRGPKDTRDLSLNLATDMVHLAYPQRNREAIKGELADHLDKGKAFECFRQIVEAQGGDVKTFEYPSKLVNAKIQMPVFPEGQQNVPTIKAIDVRALGMAILLLGGGRRKTDDSIDHSVGMTNLKHVGDTLEGEEPLCMVYGNDDALVQEASLMIRKAYTFE